MTSLVREDLLSLFWRVFTVNAAVFVAGTLLFAFVPGTHDPVTEAVVLAGGLTVILIVNLLLVRLMFRPLDRLTRLMREVDLLRPGQRLTSSAPGEVGEFVAVFNEMLTRLEAERREGARRALAAQEGERRRVAQELHDQIGQALTAVLLQLTRIAKRAPESLRGEIAEAQETARASLDDVRRIVRSLRPEALDDLGLTSALTALCTSFTQRTGIRVRRSLEGDFPRLDPDAELVLYRVAQESLTNVARHAHASQVELRLEQEAHGVTLRVIDDGRGLDGAAPGDGIRGMRERALLIGARLALEPHPRGGLEVRLEVPVGEKVECLSR